MEEITVGTDSTANLPAEWIKQYYTHVNPLKIHLGSKTFPDGIGPTSSEFCKRLAYSKFLSTIAQQVKQDLSCLG